MQILNRSNPIGYLTVFGHMHFGPSRAKISVIKQNMTKVRTLMQHGPFYCLKRVTQCKVSVECALFQYFAATSSNEKRLPS